MSEEAHIERESDVAEQFDDMHQQRHAATLGMWIFLATEVLLFGGLFTAFTAYRLSYPQAWEAASGHLYITIGAVNTAVLLFSSLFVALAVHAAQLGHNRSVAKHLWVAIGMGLLFLVLKGVEYYLDIREGLLPWHNFHTEGPNPDQQKLFMVFYWFITGLHATHMVIGTTILVVLAIMAHRGRFSSEYYTPVEIGGLYWHFVDIVWIFVFPTLYLIHPQPHLF